MSKLTKLLEYSCAGNSGRRSLMDNDSFINTFSKSEKQLLLDETEQTYLIQKEIVEAIVNGAKSRYSARYVVPIIHTNTNSCRINREVTISGQYAGYVAEGADIPEETIRFYNSGSNIQIKKAAINAPITHELIEDSKYDLIELELNKAGARLENKLNQEVITTLLDGVSGPGNVTPQGAHLGTYDVGIAKGYVDSYGWMADSMLLTPMGCGYLMDETNMTEIVIGNYPLIGLNTRILDAITDGTGTAYWDNTVAANHYTALVFDAKDFAAIAMREDLNMKQSEDPIHDLENLVVKMRFGVGVVNADAGCRILSK